MDGFTKFEWHVSMEIVSDPESFHCEWSEKINYNNTGTASTDGTRPLFSLQLGINQSITCFDPVPFTPPYDDRTLSVANSSIAFNLLGIGVWEADSAFGEEMSCLVHCSGY